MILVCGPALDKHETLRSVDILREVDLPNSTSFVVTTGKVEVAPGIRTHNVEAGYPLDLPFFRTQSSWAHPGRTEDLCFRDGYDLYCFRGLLRKHPAFQLAILLRKGPHLRARWDGIEQALAGNPFVTFGAAPGDDGENGNLLVDLRHERAMTFLDLAVDFYRSGAAYAVDPYTLNGSLKLAAQADTMVGNLDRQKQT
jgi:hypothetical protein